MSDAGKGSLSSSVKVLRGCLLVVSGVSKCELCEVLVCDVVGCCLLLVGCRWRMGVLVMSGAACG